MYGNLHSAKETLCPFTYFIFQTANQLMDSWIGPNGRLLTCDIQLNSVVARWGILKINSTAVDAFVGHRCPVDDQMTFARYLAV